jgi:flagellar hook-basal body complex protein FliE
MISVTPIGAMATSATAMTQSARPPAPTTEASGVSFTDIFNQMTQDAVGSIKSAETAAITGVQGKVSVQHVVDSIMAGQRALQTLIAVRDKAVSAYQDISRMVI